MEFDKSDVVGDAGGSTGSEMSLEDFLNNLSENFEQVENILEKADKTGLALGNTGGGNPQAQGSQRGSGQKVQDVINNNRGGGSSQESTSNSANAQPDPSSSVNLAEIVYKMLDRFDDSTEMDVVEQEIKGHVAHVFTEIPEGATVGDIREWLETPMGQKILNDKAGDLI